MRSIYAAHLAFADGTSFEDVVRAAAGWPCRGRTPDEVRDDLSPGRRSYELDVPGFRGGPSSRHNLSVEVFQSEQQGRLWELTWRHRHSDDAELFMDNEVAVCEHDGKVNASLTIRTVWSRPQVAMPRYGFSAPRFTRDMLDKFPVEDAGRRLSGAPTRLDAADAYGFVHDVLLNPDRTRPVVFISDDPRTMKPLVDPEELARELAGLAHVYFSLYGQPGARITRELGEPLGCRNGAMRVWWPHLTLDSQPRDHRLWTARALRDWQPPGTPAEALFRTMNIAAATAAAPAANVIVKRAARREALSATTDVNKLTEIAELAIAENDDLVEQLKQAENNREMAVLERDDLYMQLEELREDKRLVEKSMSEALAASTMAETPAEDSTAEFAVVEADPPQSVLEAVKQAAPQCTYLVFADRAYETAAESPYEFPEDILDDLLKLERLAKLWARPEGIGGMDLAAKARELGLTWKGGISSTTTGGTKARQYEFTWKNEKLTVGPHTRRDRGTGASHVARIYLYKHEPDDPAERRLVVGIVGRKREDSTTG